MMTDQSRLNKNEPGDSQQDRRISKVADVFKKILTFVLEAVLVFELFVTVRNLRLYIEYKSIEQRFAMLSHSSAVEDASLVSEKFDEVLYETTIENFPEFEYAGE